jgi:FXSXX-COOH protein
MDSAQFTPTGLGTRPAPDLRGVPLTELAGRAGDGDEVILDVAARMIDGEENPSHVQATTFNSAI